MSSYHHMPRQVRPAVSPPASIVALFHQGLVPPDYPLDDSGGRPNVVALLKRRSAGGWNRTERMSWLTLAHESSAVGVPVSVGEASIEASPPMPPAGRGSPLHPQCFSAGAPRAAVKPAFSSKARLDNPGMPFELVETLTIRKQ